MPGTESIGIFSNMNKIQAIVKGQLTVAAVINQSSKKSVHAVSIVT